MIVRDACDDDVSAMVSIVRRSITELCAEEYRNDPDVLARWLANKTSENFRRWIADDRHRVVVAAGEFGLMGVGMVSTDGEIQLTYVSPDCRFQGVSKSLVNAMEQCVRSAGVSETRLLSTQSACRMYASLGYEAISEEASRFGTLPGVLMRKRLSGPSADA